MKINFYLKIGVIINEIIDIIPIYDKKSFCNVSFKENVNELFAKNNISSKKALINENNKKEINKYKNIISNNTKKKNIFEKTYYK